MRKRILILIIILILGGVGWYIYNKSKSVPNTDSTSSGFKDFFSFGDKNNVNNPDNTISENPSTGTQTENKTTSQFKQITPHTVAGYTIFKITNTITIPASTPKGKPTIQTSTDHVLRYVSRNSGYVYEIRNSGTPIQITNIYVANIYEALFADGGKTAILRFLGNDAKTIASYSVPIPEKNIDGTRTQKTGTYLPDNISTIATSPDGSLVARLTPDGTNIVLSSTTSTNKNRRELFRSPYHEWLTSWVANGLFLQTKASAFAPGFLYQVDTTEKRLKRVLGDISGLTTSVSPKGTYVLYSQSTNQGFITKILNINSGVTRNIGASILPEKCTWTAAEDLICAGGGNLPDATYPDAWYAGTVHFSDQLFHIYTGSNVFDVLYTPTETGSFDMTNLQVDEDSNLLYFIDKQTGLLWQFTL